MISTVLLELARIMPIVLTVGAALALALAVRDRR